MKMMIPHSLSPRRLVGVSIVVLVLASALVGYMSQIQTGSVGVVVR